MLLLVIECSRVILIKHFCISYNVMGSVSCLGGTKICEISIFSWGDVGEDKAYNVALESSTDKYFSQIRVSTFCQKNSW